MDDEFSAEVGDMIGITWTNCGVVPFDYVNEFNYMDTVENPLEGCDVTLYANRHGKRYLPIIFFISFILIVV